VIQEVRSTKNPIADPNSFWRNAKIVLTLERVDLDFVGAKLCIGHLGQFL